MGAATPDGRWKMGHQNEMQRLAWCSCTTRLLTRTRGGWERFVSSKCLNSPENVSERTSV